MPHTFTNLLAHVVFSTKGRAALIPDAIRPQLHAYIGGIVRELGGTALLVNGAADHVHAARPSPGHAHHDGMHARGKDQFVAMGS